VKSLKTYNMDQDCIAILKRESNKSQYVCRAIRRLSHISREYDISEESMEDIMLELMDRIDMHTPEWKAFMVLDVLLKARK